MGAKKQKSKKTGETSQSQESSKDSKQDKVERLIKEDSDVMTGKLRNEKKLPCTDIPLRHFYAMLKKDALGWRRTWKRAMFEILLPTIVVWVMVIIRSKVKQVKNKNHWDFPQYGTFVTPWSTPKSMGLSDGITIPEGPYIQNEKNKTVVTYADLEIFNAIQKDFSRLDEFKNFQNKTQDWKTYFNPLTQWIGDNCEATKYVNRRTKWSIIGDVEGDTIANDVNYTMSNFIHVKKNMGKTMQEYLKHGQNIFKENFTIPDGFERWKSMYQIGVDTEPLIFKTKKEFLDYVQHPDYEENTGRPGICWGFEINEDIKSEKAKRDGPNIDIKIYVESRDGRTPAQGPGDDGGVVTSQMIAPPTYLPAMGRYIKSPQVWASELYYRQGYTYMHNWAINSVFRKLTNNTQANIDIGTVPMHLKEIYRDDFMQVMEGVFAFICLSNYILPMYSLILRLQSEKQVGMKTHLSIIGLSIKSQYLASFAGYVFQVTLISIGIITSMMLGNFMPKTLDRAPGLLFFIFWLQGVANYGFIILVVNLMPRDMLPKLAAKWGTLIYFCSAFIDFMVRNGGIAEWKKILVAMIIPNIATTRTSFNIVTFEWNVNGRGLSYDSTLFDKYENWRVINYFPLLLWSLTLHLTIGMLLEYHGSANQIWYSFMRWVYADRKRQKLKSIEKEEEIRMKKLSPIDKANFENKEDVSLIATGPNGPASYSKPSDFNQILEIHNLVKKFKQTEDGGTGLATTNYFTAVDHLSLNMRKGQIFAMLGHNGAGKTTTISMLTGMLHATGGSVTCFGRHVITDDPSISSAQQKQDIEYVRQVMGICPQHDILFDLLTVYEHLDIYCDFKGVNPAEKDEKIQRIMKDVGVELHANTMAKDLSGGSKRKLSVALALVADSRLVLLDEPTSGMDLTARRRLWDMLKDYKQDRIIILTTHNMDEADLLGDRIGIMSAGRLVCLGGPMFLKNRYGSGFKIELRKTDSNEPILENSKIKQYMEKHLGPGIKTMNDDSHSCSFQIPKQYCSKFEKFFEGFDKPDVQKKLNVKSYEISVTSLEEVFMTVGEEEGHHGTEGQEIIKGDGTTMKEAQKDDVALVVTLEESREINKYRRSQGTCSILVKQIAALMTRRLKAYSRNKLATLFETVVPVAIIVFGLLFTQATFLAECPSRPLVIDQFDWKQRIMVNTDLVKYNGEFANFSQGIHQESEDFDEEDSESEKWPSDLPVDIDPRILVSKLPGYNEGAYLVDWINVTDEVENDRLERIRAEEEQMKEYQLAMAKSDAAHKAQTEREGRELRAKRIREREQRRLQLAWAFIHDKCRVLTAYIGMEYQLGGKEKDASYSCRMLEVEGEGPDFRGGDWKHPGYAKELLMTKEELEEKHKHTKLGAAAWREEHDRAAKARKKAEEDRVAAREYVKARRAEELAAGAEKTHAEKTPDDYDMSPFAKYFKKFGDVLYDTRAYNETSDNEDEVFPYRVGSYYFYEANNKTKQFKVATFMNLTSQDVMALYPQFLYESILKTATGRDDLKLSVTTTPFPLVKTQRDREDSASGIFVCFVVGVGLALIPASIVSRVCHEKEQGLYHMQVVSGVSRRAYWGSFFFFDMLQTYVPCFLVASVFEAYRLDYPLVWYVLAAYPWAIVPYSYCTTFLFSKEATAQTFTIYLHFLGSGITAMIIFALRMVPTTSIWGDDLMSTMRYICPTYAVSNAILWGSTRKLLRRTRDAQVDEAERERTGWERVPQRIDDYAPFLVNNVGGDLLSLVLGAVGWWCLFILLDRVPWSRIEAELEGTWLEQWLVRRYPQPRTDSELQLDEDVIAEEARVQECEDHSVCVNKFRKVYAVPMSAPILAVERASFAVNDGECFALLGVNGAGKSTTFKSLTHVVEPTSGEIGILGRNISRDFNLVRHRIGYCPQHNCNFKSLNVYEHLKFYAWIKNLPSNMHERLINGVIRKLRLQPYKYKHADQLSGGNKRKLQTAIAILGNPLVVLLDEPSAGMDPAARRFMWKIVSGISKERQNTCVILTTHSMEEAEALSTKMGILVHGGIFRCMGTAHEIKNKFGSGYETLFKMKIMDQGLCDERIKQMGLVKGERMVMQKLVQLIIRAGGLKSSDQQLFESSAMKQIFNINESEHSSETSMVTTDQIVKALNTFLIRQEIIAAFEKKFQAVEVLESYGEQFFKIRIPPNKVSVGFMYGFVESILKESWGILQYNVSQTSLEMIFNYFAKGGIGGREEILEQEENAAQQQMGDHHDNQ